MFRNKRMTNGSSTAGTSKRRPGVEWRALGWLARHPGFTTVPAGLTLAVGQVGVPTVSGIVAGSAVGLGAWARAHPDTFDRLAAPRLRATRRRWTSYMGPRWRDVMLACELTTTHRRTDELRVPRIIKVRTTSASVDTVWVRLLPGQSVRQWETKLPELADALRVERVAVERVKPQVIALVVERSEPFTEIVDAPDMPWDAESVDLRGVFLGEDEHGNDWREPLLGQHWLVAGASGSGKGSLVWSPLRAVAPLVRDGLVRVWMVDPKRMELAAGAGVAHRYAAEPDDVLDLIEDFAEDMRRVQRDQAANRSRKVEVTPETPLNVLVMDELAPLLAFGPNARELRRLLTEIGTQGRATGHAMLGCVQEPTKDTVPIRDLFTVRVCLRATSAAHPDMVLGDGARLRGAVADEIPNTPETAGVGYVVRQRSRLPVRVRAAWVDDRQVGELVAFVTAHRPDAGTEVVYDGEIVESDADADAGDGLRAVA